MNELPGNTTIIQNLLDRLNAGNASAKEQLIHHAMERLREMAQKQIRGNPVVRRWEGTDDLLQNALIRLNRALHSVQLQSTHDFLNLAGHHIRNALIDLYRHHTGPQADGKNHASDPGRDDSRGARPLHDQGTEDTGPGEIPTADMERFHIAVGELPDDLREVFEQSFYLGMTQDEIAQAIGVSTKTIKRKFRDAKLRLGESLR